MTTLEFDKYLESIDGLINGHLIAKHPIYSHIFFEVNNGWLQLIKNLIDELIQNGWDKEVLQVKEKFGSLRFYINKNDKELNDIISKYENISSKTCEVCGDLGKTINKKGWLSTLCDKHI